MQRDAVIAAAGAAVIVLASVGLVTGALREGPLDVELAPVGVPVSASGTYQARGPSDVNGLCLQPPCTALTVVDLAFVGLPDARYWAYLAGPDTRTEVGALERSGDRHTLRFEGQGDHRDKDRFELTFHGATVWTFPLHAAPEPAPVERAGTAQVPTPAGSFHATEIGGVSVSMVAQASIPSEPAPAAHYHAWFAGVGGWVDLGAFDHDDNGATLDARIERLRLEDQTHVWVYLTVDAEPGDNGSPAGFPVLGAQLRE